VRPGATCKITHTRTWVGLLIAFTLRKYVHMHMFCVRMWDTVRICSVCCVRRRVTAPGMWDLSSYVHVCGVWASGVRVYACVCGVPLEHFWRLRAVRIIEEESAASGVCLYMCTSVCTSVCRRCVARPVILPCGPVVGTHANLRTHAFSHPQIYGHTGVGMWLFAGSALFVHY